MKLTVFLVSVAMMLYAFYALYTGIAVTTWARSVPRRSIMYWIVVLTFLIIPIGNFVMLWKGVYK
ncbi:hypothetical protein CKO51_00150 [Rhodopirellula sp. SM50]|nr:hypothetical protein [Rhodopirellula sp. SM50]PAY21520.1 hypothetical protein CKO51_00150 [Rhodopirellula sp. SM50]